MVRDQRRSAWGEVRGQTCYACGRRDKFDFTVSDDVWHRVVPTPHAGHVVCLGCFDQFARERGVDYSSAIQTLYFAGDQACFEFKRLWGNPT
jgi:hypothetical protein